MPIYRLCLLPMLVLGVWALLSGAGWLNAYLLPPPWAVAAAAGELVASGEFGHHIAASLRRVFIGFLISSTIAVPLAIFLQTFKRTEPYFRSVLEFLRATPPLATMPLVILWFGIGETSKLVVIVLASFFPIFLNVLSGLRQADGKLLELAETLDLHRWERIRFILVPSALPSAITGLRLGFGYCWRALVGAEIIAASAGLGYLILDAQELSRPDRAFVGILAIGCLGFLFDAALMRVSRLLAPWHADSEGGRIR